MCSESLAAPVSAKKLPSSTRRAVSGSAMAAQANGPRPPRGRRGRKPAPCRPGVASLPGRPEDFTSQRGCLPRSALHRLREETALRQGIPISQLGTLTPACFDTKRSLLNLGKVSQPIWTEHKNQTWVSGRGLQKSSIWVKRRWWGGGVAPAPATLAGRSELSPNFSGPQWCPHLKCG